ncbi:MAG: lactonase family protein [Kiritimatiellae bacterium]|nr:lactonase family protein [Kiritimatiellia bacterium]
MRYVTYVGGYTDARHQGIHILVTDADTGEMRAAGMAEGVENPTYLTLNRRHTRLYTSQSIPPYGTEGYTGAVAVYAVRGLELQLLAVRPTCSTVPCYVALDPTETALVFAEYHGALCGVLGLTDDGIFQDTPAVTIRHSGHGPRRDRQDRAHAHCAEVTPDGRRLCVCDLGLDRVVVYDFANWRAGLRRCERATFVAAPGAGPRHLVFRPDGRQVFLLNELDNTVVSLVRRDGGFDAVRTLSTLPAGFHGESKAAAIKISEDGRLLFASNRGHDSIVTCAIAAGSGDLVVMAVSPLTGRFPRDFQFAPGGSVALVGHELSHEIAAYAFDPAGGGLTPLPSRYAMHRPTCIKFGASVF